MAKGCVCMTRAATRSRWARPIGCLSSTTAATCAMAATAAAADVATYGAHGAHGAHDMTSAMLASASSLTVA